MQYDAIIIGGSYAGMAAALQLVRARRSVLIVDAAERRNRFTSHSHGFLGHDGVAPGDIAAAARRQLEAYPTLKWIEGRATAVTGTRDDFTVAVASSHVYESRRVLLAIGVADQLPAIPGLAERWGKSAFHCPYCHGYELDQGRIAVIATGAMSAHQAEMLTDWGEVTFLTNGSVALDVDTRAALERRRVTIEENPIERIDGKAEVVCSNGRRLSFDGLFVATRCVPSTSLAEEIGCEMEETPMGVQIHTSASKETSIRGIFACGDVAHAPHSVTLAVADGAMAGVHLHRSLLWPES